MWVEKGHVTARLGPQRGFALAYDLTVLVSSFASDAAMLMFIVCDWLREHQPDLLASGAQGFAFEADILDEKTVDVQITLPLTEVVLAQGQADGRWDLSTRDEPVPMLPDDEPWAQASPRSGSTGTRSRRWPGPDRHGRRRSRPSRPLARRLSPAPRACRAPPVPAQAGQGPARRQRPPHPRQCRTRRHPHGPRKSQRDRRGRLRRRKARMFPKAALARNLRAQTSPEAITIRFRP
jgi:hypothetical protein